MAQFRRGAQAVQDAAARTGGTKFAPTLTWETDETKYVQFLTSMDDVITVLMHRFIIVGAREDGQPKYDSFISRRDPGLDGVDGYDELMDRFGVLPTQRSIALAVELVPEFAPGQGRSKRKTVVGFDVAERSFTTRDGEDKTVPAFGLIIESPYTFFNHLATIDSVTPIDEEIFAIVRTGKGVDTSYTIMPTGEQPLDLDDLLEDFTEDFDLEEWLDELADEDRMHELIGPLPDDFKVTLYPAKGKGKGKTEEKKTSSRTRKPRNTGAGKADPEPEESNDGGDEPEEEAATAKPRQRSAKFGDLRSRVEAANKK